MRQQPFDRLYFGYTVGSDSLSVAVVKVCVHIRAADAQTTKPTWLLKKCEDELVPVLTLIVNTSLSCAEFPKELKRAFLTPLIKKIILDAEILKNYRPVSNLSFLSKLIERIVCVQLVNHLDKNGLYEVFQSAYRQLHSTETALLRVQNDILQAVDSRGGAILVLLDLSAAFDTIDHETLIRTLDINSAPHLQGSEWPCSTISLSINIKICTTTAPPFRGSISPQFTKMAA